MKYFATQFILISLLATQAWSAQANDSDAQANRLLQLAADTELANAEALAATATLNARKARQKLTTPILGQNAIERTAQDPVKPSAARSPIDNVELKSLVTAHGTTTAWIALDGELIEVKKGTQIGAITVIDLDENSVRFSDGHKSKRKWMAGFKAKAEPQRTTRGQ